MKALLTILIFTAVTGAAVTFTACDKTSNAPDSGASTLLPAVAKFYPSDGSTGVDVASGIAVKFDVPMDTASVNLAFHFSGGDDMHTWMDSLGHHQGMHGMMSMDHMMDWMDSIEIAGHMQWNALMDSCLFLPDSDMMANTEYMIYMYGSMSGHNGHMMNMDSLPYDGYLIHFTTGP